MMEIYLPRNTLAPMPQLHTVTTLLVPCHKAPHWCALLYPVVVVTSMHQCGGTLCLQYCRISQTHLANFQPIACSKTTQVPPSLFLNHRLPCYKYRKCLPIGPQKTCPHHPRVIVDQGQQVPRTILQSYSKWPP